MSTFPAPKSSVLLLLLLIVLVSCTDSRGTTSPTVADPPPDPTANLNASMPRIRMALPSTLIGAYEKLIEPFELETGIEVEFVAEESLDETVENYARHLAESADVFRTTAQRDQDRRYLLDLHPLIEQDPSFEIKDFYPNLLVEDANGAIYTLPFIAAYNIFYYDQALFDAARIEYPENGWSTDEFIQTAQQMTIRNGEVVTQWGYAPSFLGWSPLFANQLQEPIGQMDIPRSDVAVVQAVEWMSELFTLHAISPFLPLYGDTETGFDVVTELTASGQVAMWERTIGSYPEHVAGTEQLGAVAAPLSATGTLHPEPIIVGYSISAGTQHPDAAWQLVNYLSQQEALHPAEQYFVPARQSVAQSSGYWDRLNPSVAAAVRYSAENNSPPLLWGSVVELPQVFAAVVEKEVPVEEALQTLNPNYQIPADDNTPLVIATAETATENRTTIGFTTRQSYYQALADEFEKEHPDINVVVQTPDTRGGPVDPIAESHAADCFEAEGFYAEEIRDHIVPLDPFLELDSRVSHNDFFPVLLDAMTVDDTLYGLPGAVSPTIIVYNKEIFDAAGVAYPAADWTLNEFLEIARAVSSGSGDERTFAYWSVGGSYEFGDPLTQFGISILDNRLEPPTLNLIEAAPALQYWVDLVTLYEVMPPPTGVLSPGSSVPSDRNLRLDEFNRLKDGGQLAMWWASNSAGHSLVPSSAIREAQNLGIITLPVGPSGYSDNGPGWIDTAYYIRADSDQPKACWEWIQFLSTQHSAGRGMPARIEVAESQAYIDRVGEDTASIYRAAMENANIEGSQQLPFWIREGNGYAYLDEALTKAMLGADLLVVLQEAQAKFDTFRACVIDSGNFDNVGTIYRCRLTAGE